MAHAALRFEGEVVDGEVTMLPSDLVLNGRSDYEIVC